MAKAIRSLPVTTVSRRTVLVSPSTPTLYHLSKLGTDIML